MKKLTRYAQLGNRKRKVTRIACDFLMKSNSVETRGWPDSNRPFCVLASVFALQGAMLLHSSIKPTHLALNSRQIVNAKDLRQTAYAIPTCCDSIMYGWVCETLNLLLGKPIRLTNSCKSARSFSGTNESDRRGNSSAWRSSVNEQFTSLEPAQRLAETRSCRQACD